MTRKTLLIVIIGTAACTSCKFKSSKSYKDTTIIDYKIKEGPPLSPKEWHCYDVEEEKICIPANWGYVKQNEYLFVSDISKFSPDSYFAVLKQSGKDEKNAPLKYLNNLYRDLKKDTTTLLKGYQVVKAIYSDKEAYYSEFYSEINKIPYILYSTIFVRDGYLFEIALKIEKQKAQRFHEHYNDIIYNFYHKDKLIFTKNDVLKDGKVISLD